MIFDCFIFFNELDLLDIRLNVLDPVVDKFVLVEATHTHQGKLKPLYYSDNHERFKAFKDKIIHVVVDDVPTPSIFGWLKPSTARGSWEMEIYQRNAIARGLKGCKPGDTVIISDLDEVPNPKKITTFHNRPGIKVFHQKNFYYYLNCVSLSEEWYGSVMGYYRDLNSPQGFRSVSKEMHARGKKILENPLFRLSRAIKNPLLMKEVTLVNDGGWHFGYLGSADHVIAKIEAFAHDEYNTNEFKNKEALQQKIKAGKDLFGRGLDYKFIELDDSFPDYILENRDKLKHLIN